MLSFDNMLLCNACVENITGSCPASVFPFFGDETYNFFRLKYDTGPIIGPVWCLKGLGGTRWCQAGIPNSNFEDNATLI